MKNAFLSFLESFASSRSAAALDRNRDAFSLKVAQNLQATSPYVAPKRRIVGARGDSARVSASFGFPIVRIDSKQSKVFTFFSNNRKFYNFSRKIARANAVVPSPSSPRRKISPISLARRSAQTRRAPARSQAPTIPQRKTHLAQNSQTRSLKKAERRLAPASAKKRKNLSGIAKSCSNTP